MNKTFENIRAGFLTLSRIALGLPERRLGPARGSGARRVFNRRQQRAYAIGLRRSGTAQDGSQLIVNPASPRREPAS